MDRKRAKTELKSFVKISFGLFLLALGLNMFLVPNKIAAGGISGIGTILYHLLGLPVGTSMLVMNVFLFLIAFKVIGKTFGARSIFATILLSLMIDGMNYIIPMEAFTDDLLIAVIFGDLLSGMGMAIVFNNRASTGGTDIIAKIINKRSHLEIGKSLLIIDFIIAASAGFLLQSVDVGMYSLLAVLINTFTIDAFLVSINVKKQAFIISKKHENIKQRIFEEVKRGVTYLDARGGYSGHEKKAILCVVGSRQIHILLQIVREEDPQAFVAISNVNETRGEGFKDLKSPD